jgi:ATP-dependent RNA helicase DeaD
MRMLKAIERATRQPIEPIALPTRGEVAERRVAQFKQQIMDTLAEENLDFFFEVVRRMESEDNLATRQIAAALAFLAQRERPLRPDGLEEPVPSAPRAAPTAREVSASAVYKSRGEPASAVPRSRGEPDGAVSPAPTFERPVADRPERKSRAMPAAKREFGNAPLVRYRIEVGKNQGALPKEIVGAIANEGGIDGKLIGQINLFDDYSTVELPELPADALDVLKRTRVRQFALKIRHALPGEGDKPTFAKSRRPAEDAPRSRRPASAEFAKKPASRTDRDRKPAGEWKGKSLAKSFAKPKKY